MALRTEEQFWNERYRLKQTGWDIGTISIPLKAYFDQLENKNAFILIPGSGNGHEAEYLFKNGFNNVFVIDIVFMPLQDLLKRCADYPKENLIHGDFFKLQMHFDIIIEQTFFCALNPSLRSSYAQKMHELLKPDGKLVGLLFDVALNKDHPPYGGDADEYRAYFRPYFDFNVFAPCYNSVRPRKGNELFINLSRKRLETKR